MYPEVLKPEDDIEKSIRLAIKESQDKIINARIQLFRDVPFWSTLAVRLGAGQPTLSIPWFATDGERLYFNPLTVVDMPRAEIVGCLIHEADHCSSGHLWRMGARDMMDWNIAADHIVNKDVFDGGWKLPASVIIPDPAFAGLPVEEVYQRIHKRKKDGDGGQGGKPGKDGKQKPPGGCGDFFRPQEKTKAQIEDLKRDWETATVEAAKIAESRHGTVPAHLSHLIERLRRPSTGWRSILLRFAQERMLGSTSWARPNWRYSQAGILLPGREEDPQMGPMVIGWDTSGSMNSSQYREMIGGHLKHIIEDVRPSVVYIVYCDSKIHGVEEFHAGDSIQQFKPVGGGGTDFRPVFDWIATQEEEPSCMIYFTDLYGSFPQQTPPYPVMWASCTPDPNLAGPFGETVIIDTED